MKRLLAFFVEEEGQTSTEYILLVAVVALIVFKFKDIALEKLMALTGKVFDKADTMVDSINSGG